MRSVPRLRFSPLLLVLACAAACRSPSSPSSITPACAPADSANTFTIRSAALGEVRRINVYLPPGYREQPASRFPVLYMPDGGMAEDFPHVTDAVQAGISWGFLRPVIVVGIENTERRRDMTGPTEVAKDRTIAPRVGGSAAFRAFIRDELMPWVRSRYRTAGETGIVGESLAGLFVVETFFVEPELFDIYIAISPSLWWNAELLVRQAGERLKARSSLRKTLYLTSANEEDIVASTGRLAATLAADAPPGLTWFYHPMPDQFHDTIYRSSAPKAFRTVFAAKQAAAQ